MPDLRQIDADNYERDRWKAIADQQTDESVRLAKCVAALEAERDQLRQDRDTLAGEVGVARKMRDGKGPQAIGWTAAMPVTTNWRTLPVALDTIAEYDAARAATDASGALQRAEKEGGGAK